MTISTIGEGALVAGIRAGDRQAFETAFRENHERLLRFAYGQLRDRAEAEDVVHDVFLRLWRGRSELSVRSSLRGYLLTAVRHRVIDVVRHRATASRSIDMEREAADTAVAGSHDGDPAYVAELNEAIRRAVAALPDRCRTAFLLCREQDLTYAEAADVMAISPATVKTQMARALAALRVALEPFLLLIAAAGPIVR